VGLTQLFPVLLAHKGIDHGGKILHGVGDLIAQQTAAGMGQPLLGNVVFPDAEIGALDRQFVAAPGIGGLLLAARAHDGIGDGIGQRHENVLGVENLLRRGIVHADEAHETAAGEKRRLHIAVYVLHFQNFIFIWPFGPDGLEIGRDDGLMAREAVPPSVDIVRVHLLQKCFLGSDAGPAPLVGVVAGPPVGGELKNIGAVGFEEYSAVAEQPVHPVLNAPFPVQDLHGADQALFR